MTMNKLDRQRKLLEIVSARRYETMPKLAQELGVSRYTIMRDLNEVAEIAPLYTTTGRHGGVHAVKGWYYSRSYLSHDQEALLRSMLPMMDPSKQEMLEQILLTFSLPKIPKHKGE